MALLLEALRFLAALFLFAQALRFALAFYFGFLLGGEPFLLFLFFPFSFGRLELPLRFLLAGQLFARDAKFCFVIRQRSSADRSCQWIRSGARANRQHGDGSVHYCLETIEPRFARTLQHSARRGHRPAQFLKERFG